MTKIIENLLILLVIIPLLVHSRGSQSMINGRPSNHQPFMVSLRNRVWEDPFGGGHICGGATVTINLVLTAASCIRNPPTVELTVDNLLVIVGTNLRYNQSSAVAVNVRAIFIHPSYSASDRSHNVAVVETIEMPRNAVNVRWIELGIDLPLAGDECGIFGFGQAGTLTGEMK
jgi:secreted trypsin-like serine protease